jgi:dTMP kinase
MKLLSRGILISLEGIDGSGKSTTAKSISDHFASIGLPILLTKEPGGSPLGKLLRPCLQEQKIEMCPQAEFLLFAADRAQHFHEIIIPALQKGTLIFSDRLADSSLVYQGFGRGLPLSMLETINGWAMQQHKPDITLYFKVKLQTAVDRLHKRAPIRTAFEQDESFLHKVSCGFDALYENRNDIMLIDAEQPISTLHDQAVEHITSWLHNNRIVNS